jgi:threonine/homoserine/homoserine lactone efflux protein
LRARAVAVRLYAEGCLSVCLSSSHGGCGWPRCKPPHGREEAGVGAVIGDLLPLAIGVAISPMPIVAVILMLLSRQAGKTGPGFLIGWVAGIAVVTVIVLVAVGQAGNTSSGKPSTLSSVLKLCVGVLLILLAVRQWRSRPKEGETEATPKWMSTIDSFTFVKALGLGFALSAVNPKNLLLCLGAGTAIGAAHLPGAQDVVAVAVFTVIAASTVAIPVIGYLSARSRMTKPLESLRHWLIQNNATIMAVLLLVIGVVLLGKGIGGLTS